MCRRLIFLICVLLVVGLAPSASAQVPPGWSHQDIGAVAAPGDAWESGGAWTLMGSGADIFNRVDEFHFAFTELRGDGEISVRVAGITGGTNDWRKAGVMIRESLAANSRQSYMIMTPRIDGTNGGSHGWRPYTNSNSQSDNWGTPILPQYVRLVRKGNMIEGWRSPDGVTWTLQSNRTLYLDMPPVVYIGLCLTSHEDGTVTTATFDTMNLVLPNPDAAYNPGPRNGAKKVDINADLTWSAGDSATSHDVYFGTDPAVLTNVATKALGAESYDPGPLAYFTTYYWQIVEAGGAPGPVWSFTTAPDPALVSDPDLVGYYRLEGNSDDSSGYGNHGLVLGDPTWVAASPGYPGYAQAIRLDGTGDCVNIAEGPKDLYDFEQSGFTVSAWVNIEAWTTNWGHHIVGKRGEDNLSWTIRRRDNNTLCFTTRRIDNDDFSSVASPPPLGEWLHVACVRDDTNPDQHYKRIYLNGVQNNSVACKTGAVIPSSAHTTYIGARSNSGNTGPENLFTGMIDEVRIYTRALNASAIRDLALPYEATNPVPANGSTVPAIKSGTNAYMILAYKPGPAEVISREAFFSTVKADVDGRNPANSLGAPTAWPSLDSRQYVVGYDDPAIPAFARTALVTATTYYWCVDEFDGTATRLGNTWSFTVGSRVSPINTADVEPALNSSPEEGIKWVTAPDATLSWMLNGPEPTTGYIVSYGVFWGTDQTAVATEPNTAPNAVVQGSAGAPTPTSYTASGLPYNTQMFWRIDTQLLQEAPPHNKIIVEGAVWSFTTASKYAGGILREWWLGVNGNGIANLLNYPRYPDHPDGSGLVGLFEGPSTWADYYGSRYQGWLLVQKTGDYTFWIATDDNGELWLSTDENPANAVLISRCGSAGAGSAAARAWTDTDVVPSTPIPLEGGKAYYISALHKEGSGGDNAAVAWQGPDSGDVQNVIPGSHLMPYMPKAISPSPADGAKNLPLAGTMLSWTAGFDAATFDDYAAQRVYFGTDAAAVANAGVTSPEYKGAPTGTNNYGPVSLDYYKQYFWRIDGVTGGGQAVKGTVWSFTAVYDASQIVDPNLVGWWKLDGNADDSSGYGNHGIEKGSPLYVDAFDDRGIDFDGVDDYINCGNSPKLNMNTNITVACWVKSPLGPSWSPFVTKRGEDGMGWKLRRQGGTNNACFTLRGTSAADDPQGSVNINDAEWHHVAGTYDGAMRNLYVDGRLDRADFDVGVITAAPGDDVVIGAFSRAGQSPSVQTYTDATIDDARIYNRVLTEGQLAQVMRINLAWAWKPDPKNGATGVERTLTLTWYPGDYAPLTNGHYVNFGADDPANMVRVSGPQTPNNYTPSVLDLGTTYYWAVDEANAAAPGGVDAGRIWKFTTTDHIVVDNMEEYGPRITEPNVYIYQVWVDGAGDCKSISGNNTGATVDVEKSIILGGLQAMKYQYDNDGTVDNPCDNMNPIARLTYSKAEALVAQLLSGIGSDWTAGGAKALSLRFYGLTTNAIEPMWVQLTDASNNNAKVSYGAYADENISDMNETSWHEWLIDLADFTGVDVSNVKSMAIGIGAEGGGGGGSGTLYFDDIRLYGPRCILARRSADFAEFDYVGDCKVDYKELAQMATQWLVGETTEAAWAPSSTWDNNDIGITATAGGFNDNGDGSYSVTGSGADIWGTADAFHYVYKPLVGDGQMTVNVVGMTGTSLNVWQKAGVMIRETLTPGSRNAMILMSVGPGAASTFAGGDAFQWRPVTDQASFSSHSVADNIEVLMPNCVRLVRNGNNFSGFVYVNGEWVQEGQTVTIPMPETVYIGLAVTSHDNAAGIYTTATFNSVCDSSFGGLLPDLTGDDLVNFTDYAALMDRFLDEDFFP